MTAKSSAPLATDAVPACSIRSRGFDSTALAFLVIGWQYSSFSQASKAGFNGRVLYKVKMVEVRVQTGNHSQLSV